KWLAAAGHDGKVRLWDAATYQHRRTFEPTGKAPAPVSALVFDPSSSLLIWGGSNQPITAWDLAQEKERFVLDQRSVSCLAVSPDGRSLAAGSHGEAGPPDFGGAVYPVKVWDLRDGTLKKTLADHGDPVRGVAFARDSRTLASTSRCVRIWDTLDD